MTSVLGELTSPHRASAAPGRHVDWILVGSTFGIAAMGVLLIYSATRGSASDPSMTFVARQGFFVLVGAGTLAVVGSRDYRAMRTYVEPAFLVTLALLLLVLTPLGSESKGAQAWFEFAGFQAQPSELAKLVLIVALAHRIAEAGGAMDTRQLASVLGIAGLPMVLILLQPDLGTMLVFVAITIGMVLVGGARSRDLLVLVLLGVIAMAAILHSDVLAEYQKERLTTFLDPGNDLRGTTYNVDQAQIAVGSGGLTGRGLFNGAQTQGGRVPEQQTDFIFTVVGEELGFVGSATLLALYSVLLWRIWRAAQRARDPYGTLLCVGVLSMLVFQIFQNVGMAMGIMPVTGIPLPLLSYGGSSTITTFLAIGLVLNVHMRRFV